MPLWEGIPLQHHTLPSLISCFLLLQWMTCKHTIAVHQCNELLMPLWEGTPHIIPYFAQLNKLVSSSIFHCCHYNMHD
jgi:hypothetical protein